MFQHRRNLSINEYTNLEFGISDLEFAPELSFPSASDCPKTIKFGLPQRLKGSKDFVLKVF